MKVALTDYHIFSYVSITFSNLFQSILSNLKSFPLKRFCIIAQLFIFVNPLIYHFTYHFLLILLFTLSLPYYVNSNYEVEGFTFQEVLLCFASVLMSFSIVECFGRDYAYNM